MYLSFEEKRQVFANVRELLQTYGGVWITPDFNTKEALALWQNEPALQKADQKIGSLTSRSFSETQFDNRDRAKQFALDQGFQVEEFSMLEVIDQLSSILMLGIDLERTKPVLAAAPVFALSLA